MHAMTTDKKLFVCLVLSIMIGMETSCASSTPTTQVSTIATPSPSPQPTATPSPSPTPDNRKMATVIDGMAQLCRSKGSAANSACLGFLTVGTSVEVINQEG